MEESKSPLPPAVLLIENDENDVFFFRRAVARSGWPGDVRVVGTATEARAYLKNEDPFTDREYYRRPRLIVADYRLAGQTALEFMRWLHSHAALSGIPIIIISGAIESLPAAIKQEVKPVGFIQKTADVEALSRAVEPYLKQFSVT